MAMTLKECDSRDAMKEKFSRIHEMVEEALAKMHGLAASLQQDDLTHDADRGENEDFTFRYFPEAQLRPISSDSQLTGNRPCTEESKYTEAACLITKDTFGDHVANGSHEHFGRAFEDESDLNSVSTASSLFHVPHRAWEVDLFLNDAEMSVEKRMESHDDGMLIEGWIGDLKVQRLKLIAAQKETVMEGRRGMEAVRNVQERLIAIEVAFSQSQKREPITMGALVAVKEELLLLQESYRKCAVEKHTLSLQLAQDREIRADENKRLAAALDSLILRHKAEVSSLRLENVRLKSSYERTVAALKEELKILQQTRIPKEQFQQIEKQNDAYRIAAEEAQKASLLATKALSVERQSRLEEMQRSDQNELRAQQNIKLWQTRCRQLDSSLNTVMTAYERANLDWPFDEHFQVVDTSKDPRIAVALPPTPAMLALAAEKQSTQNYIFDLEREIAELRAENERLHSNYAASILQNDEDRLKIDNLNAEIKNMTVEKDGIQKKAKSSLAIASAKTKAAVPKNMPVTLQYCSSESQTEEIELQGNELKEFQNNQRLQSVAGLMLKQLESRSHANRVLQQSLEDAATGINKTLIEGEYVQHEALQFMARMQIVLERLVRQNTQLKETACGERSILLKRLQQALSSNDNMRREIDYLKCMSSNVFCENNEVDPTLGPLMHQHSISIQTDLEFDQQTASASLTLMDAGCKQHSSTRRVSDGKPVIPSRKAMMSKEMLQLRSAIMAWMASTVSKTFCAWKNIVWFGECGESPNLDGTTMIVEIQNSGASITQKLTEVASNIGFVCRQWSMALQNIADIIAKEKAVKDLGDKFFSNGSQIALMISLSEHVTSLQYQNAFQTLQEDLMDDHKEILLSARRMEDVVAELKNEIVCLKSRNMEVQEDSNDLTKLVEELQKKIDDDETRQLEWSTHVESTADVWATQLKKLAEQDEALFDQNDALRKMLIDSMGQVKTPLPKLVPFENLSINVGASSLCSCDGCKDIRKRLQVVRSAALNLSAKFSSQKRAVFKGANAFLKGKSIKEEESLEKSPQLPMISPIKLNDALNENNDDAVTVLNSNGAQRTTLRIFKYQMKISKFETENARLQGKVDELQLLNDYLRAKLRNEDDMPTDHRPGTSGRLDVKSAHSLQSSRQITPRSPKATSPSKIWSPGDSLTIEATSANLNPSAATLKSAQHVFLVDPNSQQSIRIPRLIKSAGSDKHFIEDTSSCQTQTLDFMLDAAHKKIDEMHSEIIELRERSQANDKKSVEEMIERAVKLSSLKMMTQAEQLIKQTSDLKNQLKETEKQAIFERQKFAANFEAQQLLLSQQLSSARMEISRRVEKTMELRKKIETEVAISRSKEAALASAERSKEADRKTILELKDQIYQLQMAVDRATEQAHEAMSRTRDVFMCEIEAHQNITISERERELFRQLSASEHVADAAVALSRHLMQKLEETDKNGGLRHAKAADAAENAKKIGIELPFLVSSYFLKAPSVALQHLDINSSNERDQVSNRKLPQVSREPVHRSDNALALLKLVDSDFEDVQLVKTAMKRIQLRPNDGAMQLQQSPRNPVSARVLKPSKHPQDKIVAKPHPPHVHLREAPGS